MTGSAELAGVAPVQAELLKLGVSFTGYRKRTWHFSRVKKFAFFTPVTYSLNEQTCCCPLVLTELQLRVSPEDTFGVAGSRS